MKKAGIILIVIGLIIVMIPVVGGWYNRYQQKKLLEEFRAQIIIKQQEATADENIIRGYDELDDIFKAGDQEPAQTSVVTTVMTDTQQTAHGTTEPGETTAQATEPVQTTRPAPSYRPQVIGTLQIKKLKIDVIIVEGITDEDLKVGVGHFPGSAAIGDYGNCAIAGHRSYTFGRYFNRLNEVEIGDKILVSNGIETFEYVVYKTHIVEPKDTYVLNPVEGYRILTLVTCEPIYTATHRLIVHAKILD